MEWDRLRVLHRAGHMPSEQRLVLANSLGRVHVLDAMTALIRERLKSCERDLLALHKIDFAVQSFCP